MSSFSDRAMKTCHNPTILLVFLADQPGKPPLEGNESAKLKGVVDCVKQGVHHWPHTYRVQITL